MSEKLSQHVLKNYSAFVSGVNEVASIEQDLQVSPCTRWMCVRWKVRFIALLHASTIQNQVIGSSKVFDVMQVLPPPRSLGELRQGCHEGNGVTLHASAGGSPKNVDSTEGLVNDIHRI